MSAQISRAVSSILRASTTRQLQLWYLRALSNHSSSKAAECQEILGKQAEHQVPVYL